MARVDNSLGDRKLKLRLEERSGAERSGAELGAGSYLSILKDSGPGVGVFFRFFFAFSGWVWVGLLVRLLGFSRGGLLDWWLGGLVAWWRRQSELSI